MDDAGNSRDDLTLPKGTDDAEKLARQIQEEFEAGKELTLTVLKVRKLDPPQAGLCVCWSVWRGPHTVVSAGNGRGNDQRCEEHSWQLD